MKRCNIMVTLAAAALVAAGCQSKVPAFETLNGPPSRWVQPGGDLPKYVEIVSARQDIQNGLLRAQVNIKNNRRNEYRLLYRFTWLDAKGFEITSIQNDWLPKILGGYETVQIVGIAPDPRATQCVVKLQESLKQ